MSDNARQVLTTLIGVGIPVVGILLYHLITLAIHSTDNYTKRAWADVGHVVYRTGVDDEGPWSRFEGPASALSIIPAEDRKI